MAENYKNTLIYSEFQLPLTEDEGPEPDPSEYSPVNSSNYAHGIYVDPMEDDDPRDFSVANDVTSDDDYLINHVSADGDIDDFITEDLGSDEAVTPDMEEINEMLKWQQIQSDYEKSNHYDPDDEDNFDMGW